MPDHAAQQQDAADEPRLEWRLAADLGVIPTAMRTNVLRLARTARLPLAICALVAWGCTDIDTEPLPDLAVNRDADCVGITAPMAQVRGPDLSHCMPDQGEFSVEVGLTIARDGRVVSVRVPKTIGASIATCVRREAPKMEFLLVEPCEGETTDFTLTFEGLGGESSMVRRDNKQMQLTRSAMARRRGPRS